MIILGGMQEPGHGAGSCLYGLLADPDQLALVRAEPERWDDAVHEGLRWVAPIGTQTRQAVADVEVAGTVIPAGGAVGAVVASACRDESEFDDPDRFDIRRERRPNAAFGYGPHFCAGPRLRPWAGADRAAHARRRHARPRPRPATTTVAFRGWEFRAPGELHVTW